MADMPALLQSEQPPCELALTDPPEPATLGR